MSRRCADVRSAATRLVRGGRCTLLAVLLASTFPSSPVAAMGGMVAPDGAAPLAPGYGALEFSAPEPGTYDLPPLKPAPDGPVVLSSGKPSTLGEVFDGRIVLLSFIYSTCDDVNGCPLALHVMNQIKGELDSDGALAGRVRLVSFSFDPEHDTPAVLREAASGFSKGPTPWHFVTARRPDLASILARYGQFVVPAGETGRFNHTLRVYLIDGRNRIRNIYSTAFLHRDVVMADIRTVAAEERAAARGGRSGSEAAAGPGDDRRGYISAGYRTRSMSLENRTGRAADLVAVAEMPQLGLPPVPVPGVNPLTPEKVRLGRKLFYDRRLSLNNTFSCAMCHVPEQGFTSNEMATAVGTEGRTVRRNAPTLYNVAYFEHLFHDGREYALEHQVWQPMLARNEMANPGIGYVVDTVRRLPDYEGLFESVFDGRGPGMETIGMAIASYERTLVSGNSPFDRWYYGGEERALGTGAKRGFRLFVGKAGCAVCHAVGDKHALFTDNGFHDTGVGWAAAMGRESKPRPVPLAPGVSAVIPPALIRSVGEPSPNDMGRYEVTQDPADRWRYKTPTLRNIALTAPYMHNGVFGSLEEVIDFYDRGGHRHAGIDPLVRPLGLSEKEKADLAAFLRSLTGANVSVLVSDAFAAPIGDP